MRLAVDANLLLRLVLQDDETQARIAADELSRADRVVLPIVALCEFVWVLRKGYGLPREAIAASLRDVIETDSTVYDEAAVHAGLDVLEAGGDFADGVIAYLGEVQGAEMLVTFDRDAVKRLTGLDRPARLAGAAPA